MYGYFLNVRRSILRRANDRNVSFRISLRWPIHIINPVDKPNYLVLHLWLFILLYIYSQILLHLWLVDLLYLWLKVITFMVSITLWSTFIIFMVGVTFRVL